MKINLNKLNRIVQTLREKLVEYRHELTSLQLYQIRVVKEKPLDSYKQVLQEKAIQYQAVLNTINSISDDLKNLKILKFKANYESGISPILQELVALRDKKTILAHFTKRKSTLSNTITPDELTQNLLDEHIEMNSIQNQVSEITINFLDSNYIEQVLKSIDKEINKLEDVKTQINADYHVEVTISKESQEVLGL